MNEQKIVANFTQSEKRNENIIQILQMVYSQIETINLHFSLDLDQVCTTRLSTIRYFNLTVV